MPSITDFRPTAADVQALMERTPGLGELQAYRAEQQRLFLVEKAKADRQRAIQDLCRRWNDG